TESDTLSLHDALPIFAIDGALLAVDLRGLLHGVKTVVVEQQAVDLFEFFAAGDPHVDGGSRLPAGGDDRIQANLRQLGARRERRSEEHTSELQSRENL